jgi:hypothetical protein
VLKSYFTKNAGEPEKGTWNVYFNVWPLKYEFLTRKNIDAIHRFLRVDAKFVGAVGRVF